MSLEIYLFICLVTNMQIYAFRNIILNIFLSLDTALSLKSSICSQYRLMSPKMEALHSRLRTQTPNLDLGFLFPCFDLLFPLKTQRLPFRIWN